MANEILFSALGLELEAPAMLNPYFDVNLAPTVSDYETLCPAPATDHTDSIDHFSSAFERCTESFSSDWNDWSSNSSHSSESFFKVVVSIIKNS